MPRVIKRKARKDYPENGIKKGDEYYFTQLRLQRGSMVKRSLKPFKPSQLTNSPFKSGFFAAQEGWDESSKDGEAMREAGEAIREIGNECQENFDNMPDGLQQGDTGQMLENRASECERIAGELDGLAEEWDNLEDPDVTVYDGDNDPDELEDDLATAQEAYEAEQERIRDEVDGLMGDMPE